MGQRPECCIKWGGGGGGVIAMVPTLLQSNIYIKRKLRVWRDQKCHPLVGEHTYLCGPSNYHVSREAV